MYLRENFKTNSETTDLHDGSNSNEINQLSDNLLMRLQEHERLSSDYSDHLLENKLADITQPSKGTNLEHVNM